MIVEIATIMTDPARSEALWAAFAQARGVIESAKGCHGATLRRCLEQPERFLLTVQWETLEDHMVAFRGSALFSQWRAIMGPHFATAPEVLHYADH